MMQTTTARSTVSTERTMEILRGFCVLILTKNITDFAELYLYTEDAPADVFEIFTRKSSFLARMCETNAMHSEECEKRLQKLVNRDYQSYWKQ